ncbi:MAG: putative membrane protein [Saprospiraceae bacterium]|jgi:putative membrane protein
MNIGLILKGAAMGIAEAIPGVSGGTLAFITGIYEELLETIKGITPQNLKLIFSDRKAFWKAINGPFLIMLLVGMGGGLIFGVLVISHLLETQKEILWAMFFGLVLASAFFLGKDLKWRASSVLLAILGCVLSYLVTTFVPVSGSTNPIYLFLSGCLAVSALMLPGISGSFILLILGLYDIVINSLKALITEQDLSGLGTLFIFGLGVLTGLFTFARVLTWLFKRFKNGTMAVMIGILLGSLNKLWPWKRIDTAYNKETGGGMEINSIALPDTEVFKIISESNLMPTAYSEMGDAKLLGVIAAFIVGLMIVALLFRYGKKGTG